MPSLNVKRAIQARCPPTVRRYWDRVEASPIGHRLAKGAFWVLAGVAVSRGSTILASMFVARILGREGFGQFGVIQSTILMVGAFSGLGLGMAATKHVAGFRKTDPARAVRIVALSGVMSALSGAIISLLFLALAGWLAEGVLAAPEIAGSLRISAILVFLGVLNGNQIGALSGFDAFKTLAGVNVQLGVCAFPLMLAGAYCGGLTGLVWGLVACELISCTLHWLAIRRECRKTGARLVFTESFQDCRMLWSFGFPALLAGSLLPLVNWACNSLLVNSPKGYSELGILNAANQWWGLLLLLPNLVGRPLLPLFSEQFAFGEIEVASGLLKRTMQAVAWSVSPLVLFLGLASPWIMTCYGEGFGEHWPVLLVTLVTAGLLAFQMPAGNLIAASGRMWMGFFMNLGCALVLLGLTAWLVSWGALGLAVARLIAYVIHGTWTLAFVFWVIRKKGAPPCQRKDGTFLTAPAYLRSRT